jgi:DNA-binding HxlR family transcriptional regulator
MKRTGRKSNCPINYSLERIGDTWSLLILRDIVFSGKKTYSEFLDSDERIATNVLASKLVSLEREGILRKSPHPTDKRKDFYTLSEKGLDLIPMLFEMTRWGIAYDSKTEKSVKNFMRKYNKNKTGVIKETIKKVRAGGSVF